MLFEALPAPVRAALAHQAPQRAFADGQIIQQKGEEADGFWLIEHGAVSVGQFTPGGEFRGVALLGPAICTANWRCCRVARGSSTRWRAGLPASG